MFTKLKIVIAGGSGFVGRAMVERWSADNDVVILTRNIPRQANNSYTDNTPIKAARYVEWDGKTIGKWKAELEGADILINLAGKSVNCRYTEANKNEIMRSRVDATNILGLAVCDMKQPPALWINGASATIYRHAQDRPQDEETGEIHNDFSVQVCRAREAAFNMWQLPHTRKAILRMAIVLGKGGVLVPYKRLATLGLGGRQGSGRQMFSWVHIEDVCRMVEWLHEHEEQSGVYNAAAPNPVTNETFMQTVREQLGISFGMPAQDWMLKLGAALIGTETELLLKSRWVVPARLQKNGFKFRFPTVDDALKPLMLGR